MSVDDVELLPETIVAEQPLEAFDGVPGLQLQGWVAPQGPHALLTAILYFMWANRDLGPMRVWLRLSESREKIQARR